MARTMLALTLLELSSGIRPEGRSMLTTGASLWLIYLTSEENPPARGLSSPAPKSPSTTSVSASSTGGSKFTLTSTKFSTLTLSTSRFLLVAQSGERLLWMLKR